MAGPSKIIPPDRKVSAPTVVDLTTEIYDAENDELLIVRETDIPGLIELRYDIKGETFTPVYFTPEQAVDVGASLISFANQIKARERLASIQGADNDL